MAEKKPGIDQALIRDLANILNETDLTEIEVEQDDLRIRVSRAGTPQYVQAPIAAPAMQQPLHPQPHRSLPRLRQQQRATRQTPSPHRWSAPSTCRRLRAPARSSKSARPSRKARRFSSSKR